MDQKPSFKKFAIMFVRILVLCLLAYLIVNGVKLLFGLA